MNYQTARCAVPTVVSDMVEEYPQRKPNRLREYDYSSAGYYFVTVCLKNSKKYFGNIENGNMILSSAGSITKKYWMNIPNHYNSIQLDEFVIMPNHLHGIIIIEDEKLITHNKLSSDNPQHRKHNKLSVIIRTFKTLSKRDIINNSEFKDFDWQRSFYDNVVRNEKALAEIREYIQENPLKWHLDKYYIA